MGNESNTISLCVGDIVYDIVTGDVGILLKQVVRSREKEPYPYTRVPDGFILYAWRVWWVPSDDTLYTESGLIGMIESGRLILYKNI